MIAGSVRAGIVLAAGQVASYVAVPGDDRPDVMLALLAPHAVRLPIGVCVGAGPLPPRGCTVRLGDGLVTTPDQTWRPVRWWDPRPHLDAEALVARADVLLEVLRAEPATAFGMPVDHAFDVAAALAGGDPAAACGVLGLGPGLTPAGDDVVAGACAVLAIAGRLGDPVRHALETRARTRTTPLSSALVAAAGRGEMIPQAARLLTSVAGGDPHPRVGAAAQALFAVGSTSGHDLAAGMAGALRAADAPQEIAPQRALHDFAGTPR